MFENKLLVDIYVLNLDKHFEIFIPVDEKVGNIVKLVKNSIINGLVENRNFALMNLYSGNVYKNNDVVRNTDIQNETKLILV